MNVYESERSLCEYLLFHYGSEEEVLPYPFGPRDALGYPVRCVAECLNPELLPPNARALDLGCAVGRSTFELARHCAEVVGIDFSARFIEAATALADGKRLRYARLDEGALTTELEAKAPGDLRGTVRFERGDATDLPGSLGQFDVVLLANLIDRLSDPARCLLQLAGLVRAGGQLIITSPYTWLPEFTAPENWIGGALRDGKKMTTLSGLREFLSASFSFVATKDLPFLIREHARKYQWSVAQASLWVRR